MSAQSARLPKRSVALRARVVSALLVYRAHMRRQMCRRPERSVALRARVISALLVHRAHMPRQMVRLPERSVALRARVSARLSKLFHHSCVWLWRGPLNFVENDARSTVERCGNAKCSGRMDLRAAPSHAKCFRGSLACIRRNRKITFH